MDQEGEVQGLLQRRGGEMEMKMCRLMAELRAGGRHGESEIVGLCVAAGSDTQKRAKGAT